VSRVHVKPVLNIAFKNNDRNRVTRGTALIEAAGSDSAPLSINCGGVPLWETIRQPKTIWKAKTFSLLVFLCSLALIIGMRFSDLLKGTDFPDFYCAGHILADGQGHRLYDPELQHEYQVRYVGRMGTLYIHPPFEAVLYVGLAWLPLKQAYLLWWSLNYAVLAIAMRRLAKQTPLPWDWRTLVVASFTFVPCLLCFLQGQDSLLLLLLVVLAFTALRQGRDFACGCWLGLGLFKFELVLPLTLVLALTQSRGTGLKVGRGFGLIALALAGVSEVVSGWSVFSIYPRFLLNLQEQPFAGIVPRAMANFRGLAYLVFRQDGGGGAVITVAVCSALALVATVKDWKLAIGSGRSPTTSRDEFDLAFANTVLFGLLVSYHLNPHDLSLVLLPLFVLLSQFFARTRQPVSTSSAPTTNTRTQGWIIVTLVAISFLPPLHLWTLRAGAYALMGLPLLTLFLTLALRTRQIKPALPPL
jgi:hypothetical protein